MDVADDLTPLTLGAVRFEASTRTQKRLFGRAKSIQTVRVSVDGHAIEFDYSDVLGLADGPILVEAVPSDAGGDYFLVSPSLVESSSAVGANLQGAHFQNDSVLLLNGACILAEVTAAQQSELVAWLQRVA